MSIFLSFSFSSQLSYFNSPHKFMAKNHMERNSPQTRNRRKSGMLICLLNHVYLLRWTCFFDMFLFVYFICYSQMYLLHLSLFVTYQFICYIQVYLLHPRLFVTSNFVFSSVYLSHLFVLPYYLLHQTKILYYSNFGVLRSKTFPGSRPRRVVNGCIFNVLLLSMIFVIIGIEGIAGSRRNETASEIDDDGNWF